MLQICDRLTNDANQCLQHDKQHVNIFEIFSTFRNSYDSQSLRAFCMLVKSLKYVLWYGYQCGYKTVRSQNYQKVIGTL